MSTAILIKHADTLKPYVLGVFIKNNNRRRTAFSNAGISLFFYFYHYSLRSVSWAGSYSFDKKRPAFTPYLVKKYQHYYGNKFGEANV